MNANRQRDRDAASDSDEEEDTHRGAAAARTEVDNEEDVEVGDDAALNDTVEFEEDGEIEFSRIPQAPAPPDWWEVLKNTLVFWEIYVYFQILSKQRFTVQDSSSATPPKMRSGRIIHFLR